MLFLLSADFFCSKSTFFKIFFQEYHQSAKQFGSRSGPTYQQTALYGNSYYWQLTCSLLIIFANSLDPDI